MDENMKGKLRLGAGAAVAAVAIWVAVRAARADKPPQPGPTDGSGQRPEQPVEAPTGLVNVYGRVYDGETEEPLSGVSVQVKESGQSVMTDSSGDYVLQMGIDHEWTLEFLKAGYQRAGQLVTVRSADVIVNMQMFVAPVELPPGISAISIPSTMVATVEGGGQILGMYWTVRFECPVVNNGNAAVTVGLSWRDNIGVNVSSSPRRVTLQPGDTYMWTLTQMVDFRRLSVYEVTVWGDWEGNNVSVGRAVA